MRVPLLMALGAFALAGCGGGDKHLPVIGFLTKESNVTLDQAHDGYVKGLADAGYVDGKNVKILFKDAQGDVATTQLIAKDFVRQNVDLIATASTPALQAALKATSSVPIVFSAVVDPAAAGAVKDGQQLPNVTGISNLLPVDKGLELVAKIMPNAKKIGTLYDPSEPFTATIQQIAHKKAAELGLELIEVAYTNPNDVVTGVHALKARGAQCIMQYPGVALYTSIGNEIKEAQNQGLPVISVEPNHAKAGAVAAVGWDFYQAGHDAGAAAARVLKGEKPGSIPIKSVQKEVLAVNPAAAATFNLKIPEEIRSRAQIAEVGGAPGK